MHTHIFIQFCRHVILNQFDYSFVFHRTKKKKKQNIQEQHEGEQMFTAFNFFHVKLCFYVLDYVHNSCTNEGYYETTAATNPAVGAMMQLPSQLQPVMS